MIVANWKMNGSKELITSWMSNFSSNVELLEDRLCILMPPSCYMEFVKDKILEERINIKLGSQTFAVDTSSPLTGGVSLDMLLEFGCEYVLIGHSEERDRLKETEEVLIGKLESAINKKMRPIYCVGETLEDKNNGNTKNILSRQLEVIKKEALNTVIIAYEPIWAIGTGQNAETSYINEIHQFIKQEVKIKLKSSNDIQTIYGGSVNIENYKEIYSSEHVDGLLIGGASLDHNIFSTIYNLA
tara:strand:- start:897 stop:1625 length:729 start_codon:yes stop_codon:yes gene_type:complete